MAKSVVHSDPEVLGGTPVFVGTRVPVKALLDYLEEGRPLDEFLNDFPSVSRDQAIAAREQARRYLRRTKPKQPFVAHPKYGSKTIPSGLSVPVAEILRSHWHYDKDSIFPESVLIADTSKQNYATYPRAYYVDLCKQCRLCERRFIFFAREQRHWFEVLRFYVDADCVLCPECRRRSQTIRRRLKRYSELIPQKKRSREDLMKLVEDAAYLLGEGVLRDLDRLGWLKNEARRQIPDYPGTAQLERAIRQARGVASNEV